MKPAPSAVYVVFAQAMRERKQIICSYDGYVREICPVILGRSQARRKR